MMSFLILFTSLLFSVYLYVTRHFNYWKDRGVPYIKPTPFVGNLGSIFQLKCSIGQYLTKLHHENKEKPYIGIFLADKPCLVIRDYNLIVKIMSTDFSSFDGHILKIYPQKDMIGSKSLFVLEGKEWKNTRAKLSPIFTTKKHRVVFDTMLKVGEEFENLMSKGSEVSIKELLYGNAADVISNAVFGINGRAMSDPKHDKMRMAGRKLFEESINQALRSNMAFLAPEIIKALGIAVFPEFSYQVIRDTVEFINKTKNDPQNNHGDYMDALLELRSKGPWEGNDGEMIVLDDGILAAQLFMFFTAGFETLASATIFSIYEAALNQDIQTKLRQEIREVIASNENKITFDSVKQMTYLGKFIDECLRKHPPFPFIDRACTVDYKIPGSDMVIEKGTRILFSIEALQNDEKYYENPDKIIPERFDDVEASKKKPHLPFSFGPRTCLGMSFALLVLKITLICSLRNHKLTVSDKTPKIIPLAPRRFVSTPSIDIILNVEKCV